MMHDMFAYQIMLSHQLLAERRAERQAQARELQRRAKHEERER
jgi:hypothetical protein